MAGVNPNLLFLMLSGNKPTQKTNRARVNNLRVRLKQFTLESERDVISNLAIERTYSKAMHHLASVAATILISSLMYLPRPFTWVMLPFVLDLPHLSRNQQKQTQ